MNEAAHTSQEWEDAAIAALARRDMAGLGHILNLMAEDGYPETKRKVLEWLKS